MVVELWLRIKIDVGIESPLLGALSILESNNPFKGLSMAVEGKGVMYVARKK